MSVVAYVPDMFDRSRLPASVRFVATTGDLTSSDEDVVVLDLTRPGVLPLLGILARPGRRIVGFANHMNESVLSAARDAGCEALPRSRFFANTEQYLTPNDPG
jgi:hypothetical protein